jgi:cysteine desulfurase
VDVDEDGKIKVDEVKKAIKKETILITVMHANNEVCSPFILISF